MSKTVQASQRRWNAKSAVRAVTEGRYRLVRGEEGGWKTRLLVIVPSLGEPPVMRGGALYYKMVSLGEGIEIGLNVP